MAREGKCEKGGEWEDEDTGWEEAMVWMLNGGDMICQCKCTEDGGFFAMVYTHKRKLCVESVDNRIIMF